MTSYFLQIGTSKLCIPIPNQYKLPTHKNMPGTPQILDTFENPNCCDSLIDPKTAKVKDSFESLLHYEKKFTKSLCFGVN